MRVKRTAMIIIAATLTSGALHAETPKALKCQFPKGVTYDGGKLEEDAQKDFSLIFDSIDLTKGTARLIGNIGASDVVVIANASTLNFIEVTPVGYLNVTTLFHLPEMPAVHSRHVVIIDEPMPSQRYGTCKPF